jgi:hypothetical protein
LTDDPLAQSLERALRTIARIRQGESHAADFRIARLKEFVSCLRLARTRGITKMLMAGSQNAEWRYLNLFRKIIGGREIAVAIYENAADDKYRIVR